MRVIYIAGPYSAATPEGVARNVQAAATAGRHCMHLGWAVVCPHSMTHGWEHEAGPIVFSGANSMTYAYDCDALAYEQFIATDLELLRRCDAVCLVGDWQHSRGAMGELALADELGLPAWELADVPRIWCARATASVAGHDGTYACEMFSDPVDGLIHAKTLAPPYIEVAAATHKECCALLWDALDARLSDVPEASA